MRLALFRRFPSLIWRPRQSDAILSTADRAAFPEFAADFDVLDRELIPHFVERNGDALRRQNQFRLDQVILIFGGALAAMLGAIQAANAEWLWPSVIEIAVAGALSAVAFRQKQLRARDRYSTNRLKAEALRGEYFLFLGRIGMYGDEH